MPTKRKTSTAKARKLQDYCRPADVCGQRFRIVIDNAITEAGLMEPELGIIRLRTIDRCTGAPLSEDFIQDTLFHELFHAMLHASGIAWVFRARLKMSSRAWHAFEEDMDRLMTPALLATLKRAGMLVFPKLPPRSRHRSA